MATCFSMYKKKFISIRQTLEFVKSFGGYVVNDEDKYEDIPDDAIGIVEKGDAIIWVYYRSDLSEFNEGILLFNNVFGTNAEAIITVEHGKGKGTDKLARDFYLAFIKKYPDTYVLGRQDKFFDFNALSKFLINNEGVWEFLIKH